MAVKMVCLDLDGTLLNDRKEISERTMHALELAAAQGALIVPVTGRFYEGIPEELRQKPFVRYAIICNGAQLYDGRERKILDRCEIPLKLAMDLIESLTDKPVLYSGFVDNFAYVGKGDMERFPEFISDPYLLHMFQSMWIPLDVELVQFMREKGMPLQKILILFKSVEERVAASESYSSLFPELVFSSSMPANIEINYRGATKGAGLLKLCEMLGIDPADAVAFGDGVNDTSMIEAAGIGVAMGNAVPELKEIADRVTLTNNEDGVAVMLEELLK